MKKFLSAFLIGFTIASQTFAASAPISSGQLGIYVVNLGLYATHATMDAEIAKARLLHVGVIRTNSDMMDKVWTATNTWDFSDMDYFANLLRANGMKWYFTAPARAAWMTADGSCQAINPYLGVGTPGTTQCMASNAALPAIYVSTMVTRYNDVIDTMEAPYNEPDLSASTDVKKIADIFTRQAKAGLDVNPNLRISMPALANPTITVLNGGLTAGATTFIGGHFLSNFYSCVQSSLSYVGHGVTMSSFTTSSHPYFQAEGGNQTFQKVISTETAMSGTYGNSTPTLDFSEVNSAGGTPSGSTTTWSSDSAIDITKGFALFFSTNTAWTITPGRFIVHNMADLPVSVTTGTPTALTPKGVFYVVQKLFEFAGYTPIGDQGDGSNVRKFLFKNGSRNVWLAWTESGTSSWALNPTSTVYLTDMNGITTMQPSSAFSPYTLTTNPVIVQEVLSDESRGGTWTGGILK